jgi:hypothetical protein
MFGKLTKQTLTNAFHNTKKHLGSAYHHTKHVLGAIDHGVRIAKTVYGAISPYIDELGGGGIHKHAIKAIGDYENIRNKVMDTHDKGEKIYSDINKKLSKKHY